MKMLRVLFFLFMATLSAEPIYTLPGIVGKQGELWVGSDHLFNVAPNIGVQVEVMTPDRSDIFVDEQQLKGLVSSLFNRYGIQPHAESRPGKPDLPLFNVFIIIQKLADRWVVYVSGRLFEEVELARVRLDQNITFQAITWEKEHMIIVTEKEAQREIRDTVTEIADHFGQRYAFFESIKKRTE